MESFGIIEMLEWYLVGFSVTFGSTAINVKTEHIEMERQKNSVR